MVKSLRLFTQKMGMLGSMGRVGIMGKREHH